MHIMNDQATTADAQLDLFPDVATPASDGAAPSTPAPTPEAKAVPRLRRPERNQTLMICESLDQRIEADHPVRAVWTFVDQLDLTPLLERIKAVEGHVGRN